MNRYFLRQSVTRKNQIGGSRRRTTTVPGARASPLITCPGPLGGGTVGEDLERPSQSQSWNPGVKPTMRYKVTMCIATRWSIGQQRQYTMSRNSTYIYMSLLLLHIIFSVFSNTTWRRVIIPYGAVPYRYRTAAVLPVLYRTVRYRYRTVRYDTVRYRYRYGGIQDWIYTVTRPL
jgi:hypothetical protein